MKWSLGWGWMGHRARTRSRRATVPAGQKVAEPPASHAAPGRRRPVGRPPATAVEMSILFVVLISCCYAVASGFLSSIPTSSLHSFNRRVIQSASDCSSSRSGNFAWSMQHEATIPGTWTLSGILDGESSFAVLNLHADRTVTAPVLVEELWKGGRGSWKINGNDFALEVHDFPSRKNISERRPDAIFFL